MGLLENVRVRRAGYAFRQSYNEFKTRYKMLSKETWPSSKHSSKSGMVWKLKASETDLNEPTHTVYTSHGLEHA